MFSVEELLSNCYVSLFRSNLTTKFDEKQARFQEINRSLDSPESFWTFPESFRTLPAFLAFRSPFLYSGSINSRKICSKLTIKTPENVIDIHHWSSLIWYFYYLWTYFTPFSSVSIVDFEQLNVRWETSRKYPLVPGVF